MSFEQLPAHAPLPPLGIQGRLGLGSSLLPGSASRAAQTQWGLPSLPTPGPTLTNLVLGFLPLLLGHTFHVEQAPEG